MKEFHLLRLIQIQALLFGLYACTTNTTTVSPVEVREYQTREYPDIPRIIAYKAVINALLDAGFTLESADSDSGVIVGMLDTTHVSVGNVAQKAALTVLFYGFNWLFTDGNVNYQRTVRVTANITDLSGSTRVRLYFSGKEYNTKGVLVRSGENKDKEFYHKVFTQIEKSIFLEENL